MGLSAAMADKTDVYFARQLGLVTIEQTIECGMSERTRRRRCAVGEWMRVHRRVYRSLAYPSSHEQRLLAAVLAAGPTAAISHYAAASSLGVERFRSGLVELSVQEHRNITLAGGSLHRIADLSPRDVMMLGPIPVTTHTRTLVDLGAVARPWLVRRARAMAPRGSRDGPAGAGDARSSRSTRSRRSGCASRDP